MELISLLGQENQNLTVSQKKVMEYLKTHDLASMEKGTHFIEGEDFLSMLLSIKQRMRPIVSGKPIKIILISMLLSLG